MPACNDEESAKATEGAHIEIATNFLSDVSGNGCPLPCRRTSYNIDVKFTNENSWVLYEGLVKRNYLQLFMFYNTLTVEEKVETLMYDLAGLLSTAGGNLGLCLGLSCLSIFYFMIWFAKILLKKVKFCSNQNKITEHESNKRHKRGRSI